ncbi:MAG: hypothetical protein AAFX93_12445 [Verrucomicrobiota bacterium]
MFYAIYKWFNRNFLSCHDAVRLVSESCERKLTFGEKLKLKILCFMCPYTARYEKQIEMMHCNLDVNAEKIADKAVKEGMSDECKARLKEKLKSDA